MASSVMPHSAAAEGDFLKIEELYGFEIDMQEVMDNHVHMFLSALPRNSPAQMV